MPPKPREILIIFCMSHTIIILKLLPKFQAPISISWGIIAATETHFVMKDAPFSVSVKVFEVTEQTRVKTPEPLYCMS